MAQIVISEISQNYTYNIGTNSFATVALPISSCWGPAYLDPTSMGVTLDEMLEETSFIRFPATQAGLESFVATYRGPASNYRMSKDYSYQMAMTLMTAGYDVLVCRLCPGTMAGGEFLASNGSSLSVKGKYAGTFGNNLRVYLQQVANKKYWNLIVYVVDASGLQNAVENLIFTLDVENSTDTIPYIDEVESNFLSLKVVGTLNDTITFTETIIGLEGGADKEADGSVDDMLAAARTYARSRYEAAGYTTEGDYEAALATRAPANTDIAQASALRYNEWLYTSAYLTYDILKDKLSYNHNRIISPGWDDQDITAITGEVVTRLNQISPLHIKLMDAAYYSRCAASLLDIPKSEPRSAVYNDSANTAETGYAQMLARYVAPNAALDVNGSLYHTHSALFAPWGQYMYVGTSKLNAAPPSFQALLIQRSMLLNQSTQFEWALPSNRKSNVRLGKLAYKVPEKLLKIWQKLEGVGVNVITQIPDLGTSLWGNSTLYEVPPATYQALANLSTRYLVNAVENVAYKCGISITFNYNNGQAYNKFYAGVTPLLDTMRNTGAIEDYYVKMSADINELDQVNSNTVIGKIYLVVNGVINDIYVDLICLPQGTDLTQFQ